jgi:hypothetical protein
MIAALSVALHVSPVELEALEPIMLATLADVLEGGG